MKHSNHIRTVLLLTYLLTGFMFSQKAFPQQEPKYTQYMYNIITVNPAYAGTQDALSMVFLSRLQWTGLEGAPRTHNFALHAPVRNHTMGLGFSVVADDYGPVSNFFLNIHYAYRVRITAKTILSMGLNGGVYNYHVGLSSLNVDGTDPAFSSDLEQKFIPNAGFGLYLYSPQFYVAASSPRLFQMPLENDNSEMQVLTLQRHFFIMGGYHIELNPQFILKPSFITRITEGAPFSTDITIRCLYKKAYGIGFSYRPDENLALLASLQVNARLMIGYAYDFPQSELRTLSNGSHEMVIHFSLTKTPKEKVISPRDF
ncbi:PorP/SprF family type IX secretion system membrane protein [Thermophagus sp. OGC60D27]|uniref:PorP/SprF family type IX secretion system membrane protein n=1 Tax=Thermophagus sp. OGC60D27 TaxID=3458415 RepID=UPI00403848FD